MTLIDTVHALPIHLGGVTLARFYSGFTVDEQAPGVSVSMLTGRAERQVYGPAAGRAVEPAPVVASWRVVLADVADGVAYARASGPYVVAAVLPIRVVATLPTDEHAGASWILPRSIGYSTVAGSRTNAPPMAWLDGVAQEVLDSGVPSAGEVVIPDSGSTVTTPAPLGGSELQVLYVPRLLGTVAALRDYGSLNESVLSLTFTEHR